MAIAARCTEAKFSLTGEEEAECIEGVEVLKCIGRLLDRSDDDWPAVLHHVRCGGGSGSCYGGKGRSRQSQKKLPCGSSGGAIVWDVDMGAFGYNCAEFRVGVGVIPAAGHKEKVKAAE